MAPLQVAAAPRGFAALSPLAKLAFENGVLRLEGSVSWAAMAHTLTGQEQIALDLGLGHNEGGRLEQCSLLLRSATILLHADGNAAESFWWSPAADAGFAFGWRYRKGVWRMVRAAPASGGRVRSDASHLSTLPSWAQISDPAQLGPALLETARRTDAAVAAGGLRPVLVGAAPYPAACARAVLAQFGVNSGAVAAPAARAQRAAQLFLQVPLADGQTAAQEGLIKALGRYSKAERAMLAPRLQVNQDGAATLLWISAGAPEHAFLVYYGTREAVTPDRIEEISLSGRGDAP